MIAVDGSTDMLEAARRRVGDRSNVDLRQGDLESLPIEDGMLDAAMLSLVLHYSPDPAQALAEVARVVKPGGRLLVVDMLPHEREEYQQQMGHVWLGIFGEADVAVSDERRFRRHADSAAAGGSRRERARAVRGGCVRARAG